MTPARPTVYPEDNDAQDWLQPVFLPRIQRRHAHAWFSSIWPPILPFCWSQLMSADLAGSSSGCSPSIPVSFLHGLIWQPFTYSFVHVGIVGTLFELLSLWFLAGFLEQLHSSTWVNGLYAVSVLGTAAGRHWRSTRAAAPLGYALPLVALYGCFGGIFGLLVAIGTLYGDTEFLLFFTIGIKARYMAVIYALISIAMLFGQQRMYAFAQLGGALAGWLYVRMAPRARNLVHAERELVRPAQRLLPLEAPPGGAQVRGLHALAGPHRALRRQRPPDRRRSGRQEAVELS